MKKMFIIGLLILVAITACAKQEAPTLAVPAPGFEDVDEMVVNEDDPAVSGPADESIDGTVVDESAVSGFSPVEIAIAGFEFEPSPVTIARGTRVVWVNMDSAPHDVTSTDGKELKSSTLSKGDTYSFTFDEVGTYEYFCSIHPNMKGQVIVE